MRANVTHKENRTIPDILLKGGKINILIKDGRIDKIFSNDRLIKTSSSDFQELRPNTIIIDASRCLISSGFTDIHVHFREPGFSYKETIATGSAAAARGGYTTVCTMPNLKPVPDSIEHIQQELDIIKSDAIIEVLPYASITEGRRGQKLVDFESLKPLSVAFSDDGSGVQSEAIMLEAMKEAKKQDCIIAAHCEDNKLLHGGYIHLGSYCLAHNHKGICSESEWGQIKRDLELCEQTGCRYHVCHISCKESVELIREAKARGIRVSCETAPHYLVLCDEDLQEEGRFKMNPPLRSAEDREALLEGLIDGTIDAIATDHAPHSDKEKSRGLAESAMGIVGLETAFSVLYTKLVRTGKLSLDRLIEALSVSPRRVMGLEDTAGLAENNYLEEGAAANVVVLGLDEKYIVDSREFASKGHSTPFDGMELFGKVKLTIYNGEIVWTDGSLV